MKRILKTSTILCLAFGLVLAFSVGSPVTAAETIKLGIIYAMTGKGSALGTKLDPPAYCAAAFGGTHLSRRVTSSSAALGCSAMV